MIGECRNIELFFMFITVLNFYYLLKIKNDVFRSNKMVNNKFKTLYDSLVGNTFKNNKGNKEIVELLNDTNSMIKLFSKTLLRIEEQNKRNEEGSGSGSGSDNDEEGSDEEYVPDDEEEDDSDSDRDYSCINKKSGNLPVLKNNNTCGYENCTVDIEKIFKGEFYCFKHFTKLKEESQ